MAQYNSRYDEYFQNNKDLQDFWDDTSQQGIFEGGEQGKYFENYGVDAAGAEQSFIDGMNKKFGTNNADMRDFTKDQFAQYHYDTYGAKEGRAIKSAQEFLDSKLPKPDNGNTDGGGNNDGGVNEFPDHKLPQQPSIGNNVNVGKDGNINTTIGNDNIFGDNATIGNDFSETVSNGSRADAKERAENYQSENTTNIGKVGNIDTSIGDGNTFGDNATIGNDYSMTLGSNGSNNNSGSSGNSSNGGSGSFNPDDMDSKQVTPPPLNSSGSGSGYDINVEAGYNTKDRQAQGQPDNPFTAITNNYLNVGKRGNMNTSIGDGNTFGIGANIGNDYSVTIGGSGDGLSNMQGAAAYTALNNNQRARSNARLNGLVRSQQAINQSNGGGWLDMAANAYNMVGMSARNSYDKSLIQNARNFGDYYGNTSLNLNPPPLKSPDQPESKVEDILKGFNK